MDSYGPSQNRKLLPTIILAPSNLKRCFEALHQIKKDIFFQKNNNLFLRNRSGVPLAGGSYGMILVPTIRTTQAFESMGRCTDKQPFTVFVGRILYRVKQPPISVLIVYHFPFFFFTFCLPRRGKPIEGSSGKTIRRENRARPPARNCEVFS